MRVGLISDTHGLLRPPALAALQGCEHIVHGGDIGRPEIIEQLAAIAPVTAVRGNNDQGPWAAVIREIEIVELAGLRIYVIHDLEQLPIDPAAQGMAVVVSGHSHMPKVQEKGGVLFVNPGSAGPRRFKLPVTVAELAISRGKATARIVDLSAALD